ncbi:UNVERIFIED_CONTAM: hypothetical protein GTU68_043722 [Idotea baltica]|nr:hypothetical protein [Idotea baltica]
MLSKKIEKALNEQIGLEAAASQKYLAMAIWCDAQGLEGSSEFFFNQSEEERMHMMKIIHYIQEADGLAVVPSLSKPSSDYKNINTVVKAAYDSEKKVTKSIHSIVDLSLVEKDHTTYNFLQWYVAEQQEEEALMRKIIDRIKLIGEGPQSLYYIDQAILKAGKEAAVAEAAN